MLRASPRAACRCARGCLSRLPSNVFEQENTIFASVFARASEQDAQGRLYDVTNLRLQVAPNAFSQVWQAIATPHASACAAASEHAARCSQRADIFRFGLARLANGSVQRRRANARRASEIFTYKGECARGCLSRFASTFSSRKTPSSLRYCHFRARSNHLRTKFGSQTIISDPSGYGAGSK